MSDLDAMLAGIVANPHEGLRWLVLADWLDDHGQPERAELTRLHRELLRTCVEPEAHPERPATHERIMELMRAGATPCVPRMTLQLPGIKPKPVNSASGACPKTGRTLGAEFFVESPTSQLLSGVDP